MEELWPQALQTAGVILAAYLQLKAERQRKNKCYCYNLWEGTKI